jgi:predicted transcriptional regulator
MQRRQSADTDQATTIRLPDGLYKTLCGYAAEHRCSQVSVIIAALEQYLTVQNQTADPV